MLNIPLFKRLSNEHLKTEAQKKAFEEYEKEREESWNKLPNIDKERLTRDTAWNEAVKKNKDLDLLNNEPKPFKSLGQGVHNDVFYYGINVYDNKPFSAVVTSNHKIYINKNYGRASEENDNQIRKEFGLNYRFDFPPDVLDYSWSNKSVKEWLSNTEPEINLKTLFNDIVKTNKFFIKHVDEREHSKVACSIIADYVNCLFETRGREFYNAEKGSGKSKQSQIYHLLGFNSILAGNISVAVIPRIVEALSPRIIIDNLDNLDDEKKKALNQIIQLGYKRGFKSILCDTNNKNAVTSFNLYSPMLINNIINLDDVSLTRCDTTFMIKCSDSVLTKRKLKPDLKYWSELRDKLRIWALSNWETVKKTYEDIEIPQLSDRVLERHIAVLTIAKLINEELFNDLINYFGSKYEQQDIQELEDDWEFIFFKEVYNTYKEGKNDFEFQLKETVHRVTKITEQDEKKFSYVIGKKLSNIPIFKKRLQKGITYYSSKLKELIKWLEVKGYFKYLEDSSINDSLTLPNSTSSSNSSNSSNSTQKEVELVELVDKETLPSQSFDALENQVNIIDKGRIKRLILDACNLKEGFKQGDDALISWVKENYSLAEKESIQEVLSKLKSEGLIYEPRAGVYKLISEVVL